MNNRRIAKRRIRPRLPIRNQTRMLFYLFIGLILAVIAWSLGAQIIDEAVLLQIYIAASILAVGVVVIDLMGLLGEHHGDEAGAYDDGSSAGDGHDSGLDYGYADDAFDFDSATGEDADYAPDADDSASYAEDHDTVYVGQGPILEAIRYLRMFVYFCLGFGLVGLAMLITGQPAQSSLAVSGIAGVVTVVAARLFYRFQPRDTGKTLSDQELILEEAIVVVPLSDKTMGRVRVSLGMEVRDVFARSAHEGTTYGRGTHVRIVSLGDDCVYVEDI